MQNPGNYHYVELYNMAKEFNLSINQLSIKFLYIDRPYCNYEFVSTGEHWQDRYNFPELENDPGEENFLRKFHPLECAKEGYVHMFPVFYKHCVIYDMNLNEEDWY